ncbi:MAG: Hsp20/alpha crystallin family protein [Pseudomonadota bacterium]
MSRESKKGFNDLRQEVDIRLDGLLGEVGKVLGEAFEKLEEGASELRHSQDIQTSKGPVRAEAGIRVRMGGATFGPGTNEVDPRPVNETPSDGHSRRSPATRPIAASILTEPGFWNLTADLPGVAEEGLDLAVKNGVLTIHARASERTYQGKFEVPEGIGRDALDISMKNGILDVTATLPGADVQ